MPKKSTTPRRDAAEEWLKSARKGETFVFWRGELSRALRTPEQNMSNEERRRHTAACRLARAEGRKPPPIRDLYAKVREDAFAVEELIDRWTYRGLIETSISLERDERVYTMKCIVQRNGLAAVRNRP